MKKQEAWEKISMNMRVWGVFSFPFSFPRESYLWSVELTFMRILHIYFLKSFSEKLNKRYALLGHLSNPLHSYAWWWPVFYPDCHFFSVMFFACMLGFIY